MKVGECSHEGVGVIPEVGEDSISVLYCYVVILAVGKGMLECFVLWFHRRCAVFFCSVDVFA